MITFALSVLGIISGLVASIATALLLGWPVSPGFTYVALTIITVGVIMIWIISGDDA